MGSCIANEVRKSAEQAKSLNTDVLLAHEKLNSIPEIKSMEDINAVIGVLSAKYSVEKSKPISVSSLDRQLLKAKPCVGASTYVDFI